jgi:NADH oxidase (H2O2-forming)
VKEYDVVVIGPSSAGLTALVTARRHFPATSILLIRDKEELPVTCGIPYAVSTVGDPRKGLVPVKRALSRYGVDDLVDKATALDRTNRTVSTASGSSVGYKRLVLATGSVPLVPSIPGLDKGNIFPITKDVSHLRDLINAVDRASRLCIVGGGYVGVEFAEECRKRRGNLHIDLVEMLAHILQHAYDKEFCLRAEEALRAQEINLHLDSTVRQFNGFKTVQRVELASGRQLRADMVILGLGMVANTELARKSGLELGPTGGIKVDKYMQTSDPNIFACGDCAEKVSFFDGAPSQLKLASIAVTEGRIAAANLFGKHRLNPGTVGVYSTYLGGKTLSGAGLTEAGAREKGYRTVVGVAKTVNRHPSAMPGAAMLEVKLVFSDQLTLLGGQVLGAESGGEIINLIAACIQQHMKADQIATMQVGTHPALTPDPVSYPLMNAAERALRQVPLATRSS